MQRVPVFVIKVENTVRSRLIIRRKRKSVFLCDLDQLRHNMEHSRVYIQGEDASTVKKHSDFLSYRLQHFLESISRLEIMLPALSSTISQFYHRAVFLAGRGDGETS